MNRIERGLVGAAMGSLAVIALHPYSRAFLTSGLKGWGPSPVIRQSPLLLENRKSLASPSDEVEASLWMEAASRAMRLRTLKTEDAASALAVASKFRRLDPDNGFWAQMEAVLEQYRGNSKEASSRWVLASRSTRWNNFKTTKTSAILRELDAKDQAPMAWHAAALYRLEGLETIRQIDLFARLQLRTLDTRSPFDLQLRMATLENGRLIRDGGRTLTVSAIGASLLQAATYPNDLQGNATPLEAHQSRTAFAAQLGTSGMHADQRKAEDAFRSNEAWQALTPSDDAEKRYQRLGWMALATTGVPGAFFVLALLGANLWVAGATLLRRPKLQTLLRPQVAPILGALLGVFVYQATRDAMAAFAVAACFSFLAFAPRPSRGKGLATFDAGPKFAVMIACIAMPVTALWAMALIGVSHAGWQVLEALDPFQPYVGSASRYFVPGGILLACMPLAAAAYAYRYRWSAVTLLFLGLRTLGKQMFVVSLALTVCLTPVAAAVDRQIADDLRKMAVNEPLYYLMQ